MGIVLVRTGVVNGVLALIILVIIEIVVDHIVSSLSLVDINQC